MQTVKIDMDREKARELYQAYKKHAHYSEPIDWELQRTYQLIAQGKVIIQALESIKQAGLNEQNHPKLAIARADARAAFCTIRNDGSCLFSEIEWGRSAPKRTIDFPPNTFGPNLPKRPYQARAALPLIPLHIRPKRGIENYHVLWEAEWKPVPVRDPFLLRRIGKGDLWLVVAAWELTEVERAALSTRVHAA